MRDMTKAELLALGRDLKSAKAAVLHKHGFTCAEIARIMCISEGNVRTIVKTSEDDK